MENILSTIGRTPIVPLNKIVKNDEAKLYLKLERINPGGSVKDRPALYIIEEAEKRGWLKPGGTIIESSSGNFGISLAMIGAVKGYEVIILVDPKTTESNIAMLKAYGAKVIVVDQQDDTGSYHKTRISLANQLYQEIPNSFRPDQCFNMLNSEVHYLKTAEELYNQFEGNINSIIIPVSTGGQIGGFSRYFKENAPHINIIAVDAVGSSIFGGESHAYLLPGMGLGWTPTNIADLSLIDQVYKVEDDDAFTMCRVLGRKEGILCGGSTGASMVVALHLAQKLNVGENIVCLAADNGERYLHSIYNEDWLIERSLTTEVNIEKIREKTKHLKPYSLNPIQNGNYRPDLVKALGVPDTTLLPV
ncbi:PLP-dependent cysteine synthase family protein [Bacillus sp. S10(2024)]|uniref:PLP-dependent cysteine synthase family protein n=1 Tax=Bacillus sp. S10(2024) TaxID=3162886 RepID=UPI003D1DAE91